MFSWIAENGKIISGPVREVYLNDPREVNSDEILTEIYALWFDTRNLILKQELKHSKVRSISS
ncbi:MAG: GyrI-like domain-containing protein [Methanosarcina sp.]|nr:GyrI-like domain-containing protein [Methanosarcina sp.]MDW5558628.1 GyrI-like domain-containing protein [Methanosarcina sp.]